jgi:hypothetical protein
MHGWSHTASWWMLRILDVVHEQTSTYLALVSDTNDRPVE